MSIMKRPVSDPLKYSNAVFGGKPGPGGRWPPQVHGTTDISDIQTTRPGYSTNLSSSQTQTAPHIPQPIDTTHFKRTAPMAAQVTTAAPSSTAQSAPSIDANTGQVDFKTQDLKDGSKVSSRLDSLMSRDSILNRKARADGEAFAVRRGLNNSSIAGTAGQAALYDFALPIAQQDAKTSFDNDQKNLALENEEVRLNAGTKIDLAKFNTEGEIQNNQFNAQLEQNNNQFNAGAENDASSALAAEQNRQRFEILSADVQAQLAGLDHTFAVEMANIENEFQLAHNLDTVQGSVYQQLVASISSITGNPEISEGDAANRIRALMIAAGAQFEYSNGQTANTRLPVRYVDPGPTQKGMIAELYNGMNTINTNNQGNDK